MPFKPDDAAINDFALAFGMIFRRLRTTAPTHDLSWTQMSVMVRLDKEGPLTTADLARAEGVKPQSMGTIIADLEDRDMLQRKPHPTDGRQMMIELTPEGLALRKSLQKARHVWLAQAIDKLDKREQETLFAAGAILKRMAEL